MCHTHTRIDDGWKMRLSNLKTQFPVDVVVCTGIALSLERHSAIGWTFQVFGTRLRRLMWPFTNPPFFLWHCIFPNPIPDRDDNNNLLTGKLCYYEMITKFVLEIRKTRGRWGIWNTWAVIWKCRKRKNWPVHSLKCVPAQCGQMRPSFVVCVPVSC